jgi:hypothetical protein
MYSRRGAAPLIPNDGLTDPLPLDQLKHSIQKSTLCTMSTTRLTVPNVCPARVFSLVSSQSLRESKVFLILLNSEVFNLRSGLLYIRQRAHILIVIQTALHHYPMK